MINYKKVHHHHLLFPKNYLGKLIMSNVRGSTPKLFLGNGVLKICSKFTGERPCRSTISIKLQSNLQVADLAKTYFWTNFMNFILEKQWNFPKSSSTVIWYHRMLIHNYQSLAAKLLSVCYEIHFEMARTRFLILLDLCYRLEHRN